MEKLLDITPGKFIIGMLMFLCLISPGLLGLVAYNQSLFINLEFMKVLLLAISLSAPGSICGMIFALADMSTTDEGVDSSDFSMIILALTPIMFNGLCFLAAIVAHLLFGANLEILYKIYVVISCLVAVISVANSIRHNAKNR